MPSPSPPSPSPPSPKHATRSDSEPQAPTSPPAPPTLSPSLAHEASTAKSAAHLSPLSVPVPCQRQGWGEPPYYASAFTSRAPCPNSAVELHTIPEGGMPAGIFSLTNTPFSPYVAPHFSHASLFFPKTTRSRSFKTCTSSTLRRGPPELAPPLP